MRLSSPAELPGLTLKSPLMNGAYIGSKTLEDVEALAQSQSGAVVVGSISLQPRQPNPGRGYWPHPQGLYALNSYGMPNGGWTYFEQHLPRMAEVAHACGKPLIANVVGFSDVEFAALTHLAQNRGADMIELNLGCPNVWEGGTQKLIPSYHANLVARTLASVKQVERLMAISVKISPLPPDILVEVSAAIAASGVVQCVTATNSYPNARTDHQTRLDEVDVLAGMTGPALKPINLGVVSQLRELLPERIAVIGCGGITSAADAHDYLDAGAQAVQMATVLVQEGLGAFGRIQSEDLAA